MVSTPFIRPLFPRCSYLPPSQKKSYIPLRMIGIDGIMIFRLHPGRLTWNLQITHVDRKMMIMFHVNLQGCKGMIWCHFVRLQEWFCSYQWVTHDRKKQGTFGMIGVSYTWHSTGWHCATSWSMRIWFTFTFKFGRSLWTAEFDLEPAFLCVFFFAVPVRSFVASCCSSWPMFGTPSNG